jgi:hypothetical protein
LPPSSPASFVGWKSHDLANLLKTPSLPEDTSLSVDIDSVNLI